MIRKYAAPEKALDAELIDQKFPHFIIDQFFLDDETVVMAIRDRYNFCMRKPVLKFGNQGPEKKAYCYISLKLIKCGFLFLSVDIG